MWAEVVNWWAVPYYGLDSHSVKLTPCMQCSLQ